MCPFNHLHQNGCFCGFLGGSCLFNHRGAYWLDPYTPAETQLTQHYQSCQAGPRRHGVQCTPPREWKTPNA